MNDDSNEGCVCIDERLERDRKELSAIRRMYDLSTRPVSEDNLAEIMDEILDTVIWLTGADMGNLHLLDEREGVLKNAVSRGFDPVSVAVIRSMNNVKPACGAALKRRERVIVRDVGKSSLFAGTAIRDVLLAAGVRSVQSTPLITREGRLVGVLSTHYRKPKRADKVDLHFVDLLAGQAADIIEQVKARQELRASEEKYRLLFESMNEGFALMEMVYGSQGEVADVRIIDVNPAYERLTGRKREKVLGRGVLEFAAPVRPGWFEKYRQVAETGRCVTFEEYAASLGRWFLVNAYSPAAGKVAATFNDVTERRRLEEALLRQSEERFQKIFHSSPAMIAILSMTDDRYVEANQKFLDVLEFTRAELLGRTPWELNVPVKGEAKRTEILMGKLVEAGELPNAEYNLRAKSGKIVTVLATAALARIGGELCRIVTMQDITKEKQMEAELLRLERLNLVGEMAASIGHEVRNPLTTVRGYLQMLERKAENARYREQFKTMIEELDRANVIISDFLSLAKNKAIRLNRYNLNNVISALLPLLQAEALRTSHEIGVAMGDVPDVELDDKEIRQLILNLAKNGLEAMAPGGRLTIASYVERHKVVLEVADTGPGIPLPVLNKLGTPFVTTKENGTGLGLAMCYRIAERHGAKMAVSTSPQGTVFKVSFAMGGRG